MEKYKLTCLVYSIVIIILEGIIILKFQDDVVSIIFTIGIIVTIISIIDILKK